MTYKKSFNLPNILQNQNKIFDITEDKLIEIDDHCKDYFFAVGLNEKQDVNKEGILIERLIDKIYDYLEQDKPYTPFRVGISM